MIKVKSFYQESKHRWLRQRTPLGKFLLIFSHVLSMWKNTLHCWLQLKTRRSSLKRRNLFLRLAIGSTPNGVYEYLKRLRKVKKLFFQNFLIFNLDEYWPMDSGTLQSYHWFMREYLFNDIDIRKEYMIIHSGKVTFNHIDHFNKSIRKDDKGVRRDKYKDFGSRKRWTHRAQWARIIKDQRHKV